MTSKKKTSPKGTQFFKTHTQPAQKRSVPPFRLLVHTGKPSSLLYQAASSVVEESLKRMVGDIQVLSFSEALFAPTSIDGILTSRPVELLSPRGARDLFLTALAWVRRIPTIFVSPTTSENLLGVPVSHKVAALYTPRQKATQNAKKTLQNKGWNEKGPPLLTVLLGNPGRRPKDSSKNNEHWIQTMAFVCRACDELTYEKKAQVLICTLDQKGKALGQWLEGFLRIQTMQIDATQLPIDQFMGLLTLCDGMAIFNENQNFLAAAAGAKAVVIENPSPRTSTSSYVGANHPSLIDILSNLITPSPHQGDPPFQSLIEDAKRETLGLETSLKKLF